MKASGRLSPMQRRFLSTTRAVRTAAVRSTRTVTAPTGSAHPDVLRDVVTTFDNKTASASDRLFRRGLWTPAGAF
jgi:hypothetical protein